MKGFNLKLDLLRKFILIFKPCVFESNKEFGELNNVEKIAEAQVKKPETENDGCNCTGLIL